MLGTAALEAAPADGACELRPAAFESSPDIVSSTYCTDGTAGGVAVLGFWLSEAVPAEGAWPCPSALQLPALKTSSPWTAPWIDATASSPSCVHHQRISASCECECH